MAEHDQDLVSRAREEFGNLEPSEELLFRAAAKCEPADYRIGSADLDDPINADQWGAERILRADLIRWLCATSKVWNCLGNGRIDILGGKIVNELRLDHIAIDVPLRFCHCNFAEAIFLRNGRLRTFDLEGTHVSSIRADEARVEGSVYLRNGFQAKGTVNLYGVSIDGNLDCDGGHFINPKGDALDGERAQIKGYCLLRNGFRAEGSVRLGVATVGVNLDCQGGHFINEGGVAFFAAGAKVEGDVRFTDNFEAKGRVELFGLKVGGSLLCERGRFSNPTGDAIQADGVNVAGFVHLRHVMAEGTVRLVSALIGRDINCEASTIKSSGDIGLLAFAVETKGSIYLHDDFEANGTVDLRNAVIAGDLDCKGGHFANLGKDALIVARARIGGAVFLSTRFSANGKVNFDNSRVNGDFRCSRGVFMNEGRQAFTAKGAEIVGNLFLNNGFQPGGHVDLRRIRVGGRLTIDAICDDNNSNDLDLRFAQVSTLNHNWRDWPKAEHLFLNGFIYSALGAKFTEDIEEKGERPLDAEDQIPTNVQPGRMHDIKWLRLQSKERFWLQPYEQLAKVLRSSGDESAAKRVLIAKQDDLRRYGDLRWWERLFNWLLGFSLKHGYEPYRALLGMLFFVLLGCGIFGWAYNNKLMTKTIDSEKILAQDYPKFNKFVYSLDAFLPIVDLKQKSYWLPNANKSIEGWSFRCGAAVRIYLWIHIVFGWILTTLWVAGFSGLVRSRN